MAFLSNLLTIALVFGLLVTFHEFGHFIVARWMGVHVLSFSIGFGPVVWSVERGGTEYAIRMLPLGGYVRMLGHDPAGEPDDDIADDPRSYHNKAVWRRVLIIAAGPGFNFLLALLVLFAGALVLEHRLVSTRVGTAIPGGPAAMAGLRSGDLIRRIDGEEVASFEDVRRSVSRRGGMATRFDIERDGKPLSLTVTPRVHVHPYAAELGISDRRGQALILADAPLATVAVEPDSPAWRAGLRSGDRVRRFHGQAIETWRDLATASGRAGQGPLEIAWSSPRWPATVARGALREGGKALAADGPLQTARLETAPSPTDRLAALGLRPGFGLIGPVVAGSTEDVHVGLRPTDEVLQLDGQAVLGTHDLGERLSQPYEDVLRDPQYRTWTPMQRLKRVQAELRPRQVLVRHIVRDDERIVLQRVLAGQAKAETATARWLLSQPQASAWLARGWFDRAAMWHVTAALDPDERPELALDLYAAVDYADPEWIDNPAPLSYALRVSGERFLHGATLILSVTGELFKGNVSIREVGGPIRMAQMTSQAADRGVKHVLDLLAALSINLGIVNLLPVPLLDGGHLLFLGIEAVRRRPASLRVRQIAAYVGLAFIGVLFLLVMKNDTQRLLASWLGP